MLFQLLAHDSRRTIWVPPEKTDPVVLHAPTRKLVALFGAVNLRGGVVVTNKPKASVTFLPGTNHPYHLRSARRFCPAATL